MASWALLLLGLRSAAASGGVYVQYPGGAGDVETAGSGDRSWSHSQEIEDPTVLNTDEFSPKWIEVSHDHHIIIEDGQKYDCHLNSATWRTSWSKNKQTWCCMSHPEFCGSMHLPFNCNEDLNNWKASWTEAKKHWCCRNFAMGCNTEQKYDCNAGYWNWQAGWTSDKKAFCCKYANRGCEVVSGPIRQCAGHEEQWDDCPEQERCVLCKPIDCLFSAWSLWKDADGCLGIASRHRSIQVENNECGLPCFGTQIESKTVEQKSMCLKLKQDCVFSTWNQWSVCENQVDQSVRSRHVDTESKNGGDACKGSTKETRPCGGPEPKPCIYSEWHQWTSCTSSCGGGYQSRMRRVASEDHLSGQTCDDALGETRECNADACPAKDCKLSEWSAWSPCSRNSMQKTRRREVLTPPEGVGMPCNVSLVEAGRCTPMAGEDCITSEWSSWSSCDKSCHGGQSMRHRRIVNYNFNGGHCPVQSLQEAKACNTQPCNGETKNCAWNLWTEWGECSHQHGAGQAKRTRSFVAATGDGEACTGATSELRACVVKAEEVLDCLWGNWSSWSECTASCGGGSQRRNRAVVQAPNAGGKACEPQTKEVVMPCNTQQCGDCRDGKWGEWSEWGSCSAKCGKAITTRHRSVVVLPNSCGILPEGLKQEFKLCDLPLCAEDSDCRLSLWSQWSSCSSACHGIQQRVRRVAALAQGNGKSCGNESLTEVADCNPMAGEPVPLTCGPVKEVKNCVLSDWSGWDACSHSCGDGHQAKHRKVLQSSANGGVLCSGNLSLVQGCNLGECPVEVAKDCKWGSWLSWGTCTSCTGQRTRNRLIQQLPTLGGKICDPKNALEMSNCSSLCDDTRFCSWAQWAGDCPKSCDRTSTRHRQMMLLPKVLDHTPLFTGNESSSCSGIQHDVADCPLADECKDICEPLHCEFGEWQDWSTGSCMGLCERERVVSQLNNKCGTPCDGALHETKSCESPCHPPVDCELSTWTEWSACSNATDGFVGGQRYRERKMKTAPKNGGLACYGDMTQTMACKGELPGPCKFGSWESWSDCSTTCGEGYKVRGRSVADLAEAGGAQCNGLLSQVTRCHAGYWEECGLGKQQDCELDEWQEWTACSVTMQRERQRHFKQAARLGGLPCLGALHQTETCQPTAVDCEVSDWTVWDECDQSCGAAQARRERAITQFPKHGGALCPTDLKQMKACSVPNCDVKDCQVSGWMEWGSCSTSCGQGHQSRQRSVLNLREPGGYGCFFSVAENRVCHNPECARDCAWHEWQSWGECSLSCGGGLMTRTRMIKHLPEDGGKHCEEKDMQEVRACNVGTCHDSCINGLWADWEAWSPCSASCNGGVSYRNREVKRMANSCGNPAIGDDKEMQFCNVDTPCEAAKDCLYTGWSSWSQCSASCLGITMRRRNIASYGRGSTGLFCQGALEEVTGCNPTKGAGAAECGEGPAVDCEMSEWTGWSDCSKSCDGGEMRRTRGITKHAQFGGAACSGRMEEVKECARSRCAGGGVPIDCVYGEWKSWGECKKCSGERKRFRHILVYPAQGGRECAPADVEEVGSCPNPCAEVKFCEWHEWSHWGACSMSCGPGGKRKRSRLMKEALRPPQPAAAASTFVESTADSTASQASQRSELLEKYRSLYARTQDMENGQVKEIILAFSCGFLAFLAIGGLVRRMRQQRDATLEDHLRDPEALGSDSERPFLAPL